MAIAKLERIKLKNKYRGSKSQNKRHVCRM